MSAGQQIQQKDYGRDSYSEGYGGGESYGSGYGGYEQYYDDYKDDLLPVLSVLALSSLLFLSDNSSYNFIDCSRKT